MTAALTHAQWQTRAKGLSMATGLFIDGRHVDAQAPVDYRQ